MDEAAKRRMIGAVVLVLLMVIFVPMLFEEEPTESQPGQDPELALDREPVFESATPSESYLPVGAELDEAQSLRDDEMEPFVVIPATDDDSSTASADTAAAPRITAEPDAVADEEAAPSPVSAAPPREPSASDATRAEARAPSVPPSPRATPSAESGGYVIQIAALSTSERAAGLASELREQGFSAFTERAEVRGKIFYRVRIGPEPNRAAAEQVAAAVARATGHQGQILALQ